MLVCSSSHLGNQSAQQIIDGRWRPALGQGYARHIRIGPGSRAVVSYFGYHFLAPKNPAVAGGVVIALCVAVALGAVLGLQHAQDATSNKALARRLSRRLS